MKQYWEKIKEYLIMFKDTFKEWNDADPWRLSAVVAYYAIFSLPALLIIVINLAGAVFGNDIIQGKISDEIGKAMGPDAAKTVQTMIANAMGSNSSNIAVIIGIATLLFGATGVFYQLQKSLNEVWQVKEDPRAGVKKVLINRATGFGLILVIGFLLLISLVISTALAALSTWVKNYLPDSLNFVFIGVDFIFSLAIITLLFAALFKFLPDVKILWKSIWPASIITSFLFVIGKYGLSIYFSKSNPASTYGATGSIILILLWISYSCLILFYGAEFIRIYARKKNQPVEPDKYAVRVETVKDTNEKLKGK